MTDAVLEERLLKLRGSDCCVADLAAEALALRETPSFQARLLVHKALCDPNRLLAAQLLAARGEMCQCELQAALGLTHATINHHMACLMKAGLVTARKDGKWLRYKLAPKVKI